MEISEGDFLYASESLTPLYESKDAEDEVNTLLMGSWMEVERTDGAWVEVHPSGGDGGWIHERAVRPEPCLKGFFVDVNQGDGVLLEGPEETRVIVDGGPNSNFQNYLNQHQYKHLLENDEQVHIDAVVVSHFDFDHFNGLIEIIADNRYEFGTIYHNGIIRFDEETTDKETEIGQTSARGDGRVLTTSFDGLDDARDLLENAKLMKTFREFLEACVKAKEQDRLDSMERVAVDDPEKRHFLDGYGDDAAVSIEVVGPVVSDADDPDYRWFGDRGTVNGHSVVLRVECEGSRMMLTGDVNEEAQRHLLSHVPWERFGVDVAKSCHHGSIYFDVSFLEAMRPVATVISSGDSNDYGHSSAEAVGAAAKHSRGDEPLVYSTELARTQSADKTIYGMVNVRMDENRLVTARMKQDSDSVNPWYAQTRDLSRVD